MTTRTCIECKQKEIEITNKVGRPRLRCDDCHVKYWKNYILRYQKNYKKKGAKDEINKTNEP